MGYKIDLTNQKFGRLTVLCFDYDKNKWKCICDCQTNSSSPQYTYVSGKQLRSGKTKSCGCLHRDKLFKDITNKRFGKLTALQLDHRDKDGRSYWKCKCDCGNTVVVAIKVLTVGGKQSCGHCLDKEMVGKKFGKLTVMGKAEIKNRNQYWYCKCDCGNEIKVSTNSLNSGNTTSCGCKRADYEDLLGRKFNYLTPIQYLGLNKWKCKCDCGKETIVLGSDLKQNKTLSCGCNNISKTGSFAENEIKDYICKFVPVDDIVKAKILGNGKFKKEIDIYIPSLNIGIEYNGSAYHASENNLFTDKPILYHQQKFLCAKEQGIHLITVFDIDYENNKWLVLERIKHIICDKNKNFFIPQNIIEYTDNDYDDGIWMKNFGYREIGQESPSSFVYKNKFLVYRCGRTIWSRG